MKSKLIPALSLAVAVGLSTSSPARADETIRLVLDLSVTVCTTSGTSCATESFDPSGFGSLIKLEDDGYTSVGRWRHLNQATGEPFWAEVQITKTAPFGEESALYSVTGKIHDSNGQKPSVHFTFTDMSRFASVALKGTPILRGNRTYTPTLYITPSASIQPIPTPTNTPLPQPTFTGSPRPTGSPTPDWSPSPAPTPSAQPTPSPSATVN